MILLSILNFSWLTNRCLIIIVLTFQHFMCIQMLVYVNARARKYSIHACMRSGNRRWINILIPLTIAINLYTHKTQCEATSFGTFFFCLHKRQPHCPHLNLVFERKKRAVRQILSVFSVIWLCPLVLNVPRWQHDSEECVRDKERRSSSFAAQYSVCKLFEHMSQAILTIFELYARTSQLNRRAIEKR